MHALPTEEPASRATRDAWSDDNARGLLYAAVGAWDDAVDAFSAAADAATEHADVAAHHALALILANLAQSCFRVGRTTDGISHAQRACSLRVALVGEDAVTVARARADLAVMLASIGRADEGFALITRAIAGIDQSAGDEDLALTTILENAARLAMSAGQPSSAEPFLLRLHALLALHDLPSDPADSLLVMVSKYRADQQHVLSRIGPLTATALEPDPASVHTTGTPTPEASTMSTGEDPEPTLSGAFIGLDFDLVDVSPPAPPLTGRAGTSTSPHLEAIASPPAPDVFGNVTFDLVDPEPVRPNNAMRSAAPAVAPVHDILGFSVEYGTPTDGDVARPADTLRPPPTSTHIPTPPDPIVVRSPTSAGGSTTVTTPAPEAAPVRAPTGAHTRVPVDEDTADRRARRPNIRAGRASAPKSSRGLAIVGAVTTALAAAAGWLALSRGG